MLSMDLYRGLFADNKGLTQNEHGLDDVTDDVTDDATDRLFEAVRKNQLDVTSQLVRTAGVDVNKLTSTSVTALYIAMEHSNVNMVRLLLDAGADVDAPSYCHLYCTYERPVVTAARLQNAEILDAILERGCRMEGETVGGRDQGKTALQWAATHGNITMAELLLAHGADVNWVGMYLHTALHYAAIADRTDMVSWLLDKGAEVNVNGDGRTPLHIAAVRGNYGIVQRLVAHRSPSSDIITAVDNFRFTPLSLACLRGHLNIVKFLLEEGATASCPSRHDLSECLRKASESGHVTVVRYLVGRGADVSEPNSSGETALALAAKGQHQVTVELLTAGACVNSVDNRGYTPLQQALIRDQRDIAALLIRHGADLYTHHPNIDSPLQIAFTMSNPILVKYILQAGCHLHSEPWFTPRLVEQKLQELDYQVPALIRFRPESGLSKQAWIWIRHTFGRTRSLAQLARIAIREQLVLATGGASILPSVEKLPLPQALISYVSFSDIFSE